MERPTEANEMFCGENVLEIEQITWDIGSDLWWCYQKCEVVHPRSILKKCIKLCWLSILMVKKILVSEIRTIIGRPSHLKYLLFPKEY